MKRSDLEHILRASAAITGADEFVVIGSQSILGGHPDAPPALLVSQEADICTFRDPADAELIEGSIGEGSPFHRTFGYFAHGVGIETATLPAGWRDRLIALRSAATGGAIGLCLDAADLAVSKLVAGREKDFVFVRIMVEHAIVLPAVLSERVTVTDLSPPDRPLVMARLRRVEHEARRKSGPS